MAVAYPDSIPTSDQEEDNQNKQVELFGILHNLQMETSFSDTEKTNPDEQLFEVVNEHNEILHVFSPTTILHPDSETSVIQLDNAHNTYNTQPEQNYHHITAVQSHTNSPATDENYDYEPPPDQMKCFQILNLN